MTVNSHLQQECCTNAKSEQPFHPRYATVTHQPYTSMSRLTHALKLPNHRLINAAKHLCPCMLVNQLQHTTPSKDLGPATVIHVLPWSSYLVCTSNGSTYHHMWRHLHECSVKVADTVPSGTTATLQALSSHHFLVAQPASPPPAPCMQPTSAAPATLATQMKQAPAVPITPAVQKNAPAPKSVASHATPVQPQRSGHAHMAPRCLIQEI